MSHAPAVHPITDVDWAYRAAIRFAHRAHVEQGDLFKYRHAVAIETAEGWADPLATAAYVRAFLSTMRALELEERERYAIHHQVWRERTAAQPIGQAWAGL